MCLGLQNLMQDKLRFVLSIVGIALAVMLILFLLGLREGFYEGGKAYLAHAPGSVVVMPPGVRNTLAFCSRGCRAEFFEDPVRFLDAIGEYSDGAVVL